MARGRMKSEHAEALELISYGLAKFAGSQKGTNVIANHMAKNRSAFFKLLVDKGLVNTSNAASNRQDNYDPFFGTKVGYVTDAKKKIYEPRKERLDSVLGNLSMEEYAELIFAIIDDECGKEITEKHKKLIKEAKAVIYEKQTVEPDTEEQKVETEEKSLVIEIEENDSTQNEKRLHTRIQWILKQIGKMAGCEVFIARNDGNRLYNDEPLNTGCLEELPRLGMDESTYKIVSLIDEVWVKNKEIVCAYEIECSTSIYSGLLRMSDLAIAMPYSQIKRIIIAPESRKDKVIEQFMRPTFSGDMIKGRIKYMTTEELIEIYNNLIALDLDEDSIKYNFLEKKSHKV